MRFDMYSYAEKNNFLITYNFNLQSFNQGTVVRDIIITECESIEEVIEKINKLKSSKDIPTDITIREIKKLRCGTIY